MTRYRWQIPLLNGRAYALGFEFIAGQRPGPNRAGHIPTTIEWARKLFREEMNDDLEIVPARYFGVEDRSEYEELLPVSPP